MSAQGDRISALTGDRLIESHMLLNELKDFISRFCVFPNSRCLTAVTLWAVHAHVIEHFHTTPRLALLSPDPGSGKTRVLEVLDMLVPQSMFSLNASPAAIFRLLDQEQITLLFDEVDAIWSGRGRDDNHEDLRSLLNAGYKRGAVIPRCVGGNHEVKRFKVYCAVALAGIGELPDTIMSRSIIIKMRRRAPHERCEPLRLRIEEAIGHALRDRIAEWADELGDDIVAEWPAMPEGIIDRNAEIWEPLLAVADAVGGSWPKLAREACVALCKAAEDRRVSLGIRLLGDLRKIFGESTAMTSKSILEELSNEDSPLDDDAPWANLRGNPIDSRKLATLLKPYGIRSCKVKIEGKSLQGYRREDLWDSWQRYLPTVESENAEPTEPSVSPSPENNMSVPEVPGVPVEREPGCDDACTRCGGEGCAWCLPVDAEVVGI
jgi:hypothetical protein